jgi:hypothetical protein
MSHTYGVEFEVIGLDTHESARAVTRAGITCNPEGYNHETRSNWKTVTDGSLPAGSSEVVSPVLDDARLNEVKTVTRALLAGGARVTRSAGFHTHFGVEGIGISNLPTLVTNWYIAHSVTELLVAPSRRAEGNSSRWARSLTLQDAERVAERVSTGRISTGENSRRYESLNLEAFDRHTTVEFRLHQGTLNGKKALAWVEYLTAFVNHSMEGHELSAGSFYRTGNARNMLNVLTDMLTSSGLSESTRDYLLARADEIAERV